jgi:parvulin-like peptidyl-prolyl isomerase
MLSGVVALLVLVVGVFAWRQYDERYAKPNEVVLSVADSDVKLSYYADRLASFVQANQSSGLSLALLEQSLLTKLEEEELTIQLAQDRGISINDDDISQSIAAELGVPVGGDGSAYDNLYRQRLKATNMSSANYRRMVKAQVADKRIREQLANDVGKTGEMITLRTVVLDTEDKAKAILDRVNRAKTWAIAQTESLDLTSRQSDGIMQPEPTALLPEALQTAIEGKSEGQIGDVVQIANNWWVFKLEKRDSAGTYADAQQQQLADQKFTDLIAQKRASTTIDKSLDPSDIDWAVSHAG